MLKKRIEKIENTLGASNLKKSNIEMIFQFFISEDESTLPEDISYAETKRAIIRAMSNGIEKYPGLLRVFNILKEENEFDDINDFLDYLKTRNYPIPKVITTHGDEEVKTGYQLLNKLDLISILHIQFVETRKIEQK